MDEKKSGALKIDWQKKEISFSPNVKLVTKKVQGNANAPEMKETIIRFEIASNKIESSECQTYFHINDIISDIGPINKGNPWYFDFCGEMIIITEEKAPPHAPVKEKLQAKTQAKTHAKTHAKTQAKTQAKTHAKTQKKVTEATPETTAQFLKQVYAIVPLFLDLLP